MDYSEILEMPPYGMGKKEKNNILYKYLVALTKRHMDHCKEYQKIIDAFFLDEIDGDAIEDIPFLPVRLFKEMDLKSVSDDMVFKTMTSSGTTGQKVSNIYLDKRTAANQQKTLVKIVSEYIGKSRVPMLIIDSPEVIKNRNMFSARGAGILGFSIFASEKKYALNNKMEIDIEGIKEFLKKHEGERILLFGFTFMIWQYFYKPLQTIDEQELLDFSNAVLIHGGGWKKLADQEVDSRKFKSELEKVCKIKEVYDYYGMVEQTGCVYMECECGHLHASIFSDVITRRTHDFKPCQYGEEGIIEVLSMIPESYPGHAILTEDKGIILGEDDCPCGRKGKYFKVTGRVQNAEIRGCSDTYVQN